MGSPWCRRSPGQQPGCLNSHRVCCGRPGAAWLLLLCCLCSCCCGCAAEPCARRRIGERRPLTATPVPLPPPRLPRAQKAPYVKKAEADKVSAVAAGRAVGRGAFAHKRLGGVGARRLLVAAAARRHRTTSPAPSSSPFARRPVTRRRRRSTRRSERCETRLGGTRLAAAARATPPDGRLRPPPPLTDHLTPSPPSHALTALLSNTPR